MYQYEIEVIPSKEATKLFRQGKISEEELLYIRKINKRKYEYSEKGKAARKRIQEKQKNDPTFKLRKAEYDKQYREKNREQIKEKRCIYQKQKKSQ